MSITITKTLQYPMFKMEEEHFHIGRDEVFYLCSGSRRFFAGCTIYTMNAGDLMYVPSGCLHRTEYNDCRSAERFVLTFPDNLTPHSKNFQRETLFHTVENSEISELLEGIFSEKENPTEYSEEIQTLLINILVIKLLRIPPALSHPAQNKFSPNDEQIQLTAKYISKHFQEKFTLEHAAEYAGFSRTYFSQKFKAVTGFGFNDYLTAVRLRNAVKLLVTTDLSITKTAYYCGFNDSNYFGGVFKRQFGMTPREYRKKYKKMS